MLTWTTEPPTEPGWYWFRVNPQGSYSYEDIFALAPTEHKLFGVPMEEYVEPILVRVYIGDDFITDFADSVKMDAAYTKQRMKAAQDYDFRSYKCGETRCIELALHGLLMVGFGDCARALDDIPLVECDMEWAGPIPEPEDAE